MQKFSDIVLVVNVPGGQARVPSAATVQVNVSGGAIATIYSDNGVTTQANPITADSTGEYSFYAADGAYDLIVAVPGFTTETKTAAVLLNSGSAGSVLTSLAASSGSSLVGFLQSGIGAIAVTVQGELRFVVRPEQFGAVGDGVTDDSTALASALTRVGTYGELRLTQGKTYKGNLVVSGLTGLNVRISGHGAKWLCAANTTGLNITNSENVTVEGIAFYGTSISGASQAGVVVTNSNKIVIDKNHFEALTTGVSFVSSLSSGGVPIPSRITNNTVTGCGNGVYVQSAAEYVDVALNTIISCTTTGVLVEAGNCKVFGNTVNQNVIGIAVDGSVSANGDHGAVLCNTINHNTTVGLYIHDLDLSMEVTGNNIWATTTTNFGAGAYATSFGVILETVKNVNFVGNVLANSKVNLGVDVVTTSVISNNTFIADSATTIFNIREITAFAVADNNKIGGNTFQGALSGGANNNDPEQTYVPTLLNSWVNFGGGYSTAAYSKDGDGIVYLRGVVKDGAGTIYTLPAGFRPATTFIAGTVSNALFGAFAVSTAGNISMTTGSNAWISMDGISFKAEA